MDFIGSMSGFLVKPQVLVVTCSCWQFRI